MAKTNSRGWFQDGGYRIDRGGLDNPPRMGVRWSPTEDHDLWLSNETGTEFDVLCKDHGRSPGSISQRLYKYEYGISRCSLGSLVFLYVCCNRKPHFRKMPDPEYGSRWVLCSKDGLLVGAHSRHLWELIYFWNRYCAASIKGWDYRYVCTGTQSNQPLCAALNPESDKSV